MYCARLRIFVLNGRYEAFYDEPTGWTHVVLNYIGSNDGQGIRGYVNGEEVASDTDKAVWSYPAGDGRIVVGRLCTDSSWYQASAEVDELVVFNHSLTVEEIQLL